MTKYKIYDSTLYNEGEFLGYVAASPGWMNIEGTILVPWYERSVLDDET